GTDQYTICKVLHPLASGQIPDLQHIFSAALKRVDCLPFERLVDFYAVPSIFLIDIRDHLPAFGIAYLQPGIEARRMRRRCFDFKRQSLACLHLDLEQVQITWTVDSSFEDCGNGNVLGLGASIVWLLFAD